MVENKSENSECQHHYLIDSVPVRGYYRGQCCKCGKTGKWPVAAGHNKKNWGRGDYSRRGLSEGDAMNCRELMNMTKMVTNETEMVTNATADQSIRRKNLPDD